MFEYSVEGGTPSAEIEPKVLNRPKRTRKERLLEKQQPIPFACNQTHGWDTLFRNALEIDGQGVRFLGSAGETNEQSE